MVRRSVCDQQEPKHRPYDAQAAEYVEGRRPPAQERGFTQVPRDGEGHHSAELTT